MSAALRPMIGRPGRRDAVVPTFAISPEQMQYVLSGARPKMRALLALVAICGLPLSELPGLRWPDLRTSPGGPALAVRTRDGVRSVPLPPAVMMALEDFGIRHFGPMFPNRSGQAAPASALRQAVTSHLRRRGCPWTPTQLRTFADTCSADPKVPERVLGHGPIDNLAACPTCGRNNPRLTRPVSHIVSRHLDPSGRRPTVNDLHLLDPRRVRWA